MADGRRGDDEKPADTLALLDAPAPVRYLILERGADDDSVGGLDFVVAHWRDPDAVVRGRAARLALAHPAAAEPTPGVVGVGRAAEAPMAAVPEGSRLLEAWAEHDSSLPGEEFWAKAAARAQTMYERTSEARALESRLRALEQGTDVVLLLDTTESMSAPFDDIRATARWLIPGLEWALPSVRVGSLFYKDAVEETIGLGARPSRDVLPRLLEARPEGGGDVPEGVLTALEEALRLGSFAWRPGATKRHAFIVGDQPCRYDEKRAFVSLARAAHTEGEIEIHTVALGGEDVPFFGEFAEAGGGRYLRCDGADLGTRMLRTLLGGTDPSPAETLESMLRGLED